MPQSPDTAKSALSSKAATDEPHLPVPHHHHRIPDKHAKNHQI
ncbi:hypothetical protein EVA_03953 [gut metagenome]|uniref:Uncharacterized protein n=1 Tax=gut metagenome TaxID=749906 RepID=J9GXT7_9ZZZZ